MDFPVEDVELARLRPYGDNPRVIGEDSVAAVAESVREFGWRVPLIVTADYEIVAGHVRYRAAERLGLERVPCHVVRDLSPERLRALRLVDNRTHELSQWDEKKLLAELLALDAAGMEMEDWFAEEVARALREEAERDPDQTPEPPEEGRSQPGALYCLGRHRLYVGDATQAQSYDTLCEGRTVDLLLTDSPYNVAYEGATDKRLTIMNDAMGAEEFRAFLGAAFRESARKLKEGGAYYVFYADREAVNFRLALEESGLSVRQQLVWVKNHFVMGRQDYQWRHEPCLYGWKEGAPHYFAGGRKQSTVLGAELALLGEEGLRRELGKLLEQNATTALEHDKPLRNADHPTSKPVDLIARLVENSCPPVTADLPGGTVLDPFGGSGSTLMACEVTGRRCLTLELDPRYADVIRRRWAEYTHGKGCDWEKITADKQE